MAISGKTLQQFKDRMRIGDYEDANLVAILSASEKALLSQCGEYDIEADEDFRELVIERGRYVYNDSLEYFNANFQSMINALGVNKALAGILVDDDGNVIEVGVV